MAAIYVSFDINGNATGFYPSDVYPTPPAGSILISQSDYEKYYSMTHYRDPQTGKPVKIEKTIDDVKIEKRGEIESEYRSETKEPVLIEVDESIYSISSLEIDILRLSFLITIAESLGETHVEIVDTDEEVHLLPMADAKKLFLAAAKNYRNTSSKRANAKVAIKHAKDKNEVGKIKWKKGGSGDNPGNSGGNNGSSNNNQGSSGDNPGSSGDNPGNSGGKPDKKTAF